MRGRYKFRIMKNPHAHLHSYIKTCVKFQKDQPKTIKGVALTKYLVHMHFNFFGGKKKSYVKNAKISEKKKFQDYEKNTSSWHAHLQSCERGVALIKYLLHMHFNSVRGKKKKSKLKMQK